MGLLICFVWDFRFLKVSWAFSFCLKGSKILLRGASLILYGQKLLKSVSNLYICSLIFQNLGGAMAPQSQRMAPSLVQYILFLGCCIVRMTCLKSLLHRLIKYLTSGRYYLKRAALSMPWFCHPQTHELTIIINIARYMICWSSNKVMSLTFLSIKLNI